MIPEFSIIIPFKGRNTFLDETLDKIDELEGPSFEVILLPDESYSQKDFKRHSYTVRIIPTGEVSPAIKRDQGAEAAHSEYLAFIDDDAFPAKDWLLQIKQSFSTSNISGVGGPQITPESDPFWAQVSGAMYLSCLNGSAVHRYFPNKNSFDVDDWPSVNLCIRKKDFLAVGGFDSSYWPGEDTKLCHDLTQKSGKRIVYCGNAIVFHHRRAGLRKHLRQLGGYGLHRGHFVRKLPKTSLRVSYFIPSVFFLFATLTPLAITSSGKSFFMAGWLLYLSAILVSFGSVQSKTGDWRVAVMSQFYLICSHYWYGFQFLRGLFSKNTLRHSLNR